MYDTQLNVSNDEVKTYPTYLDRPKVEIPNETSNVENEDKKYPIHHNDQEPIIIKHKRPTTHSHNDCSCHSHSNAPNDYKQQAKEYKELIKILQKRVAELEVELAKTKAQLA